MKDWYLVSQQEKAEQVPEPFDEDFFFKYTWSKFSPKRNLEFLLFEDEQFIGQKEIITKAISAWTVAGKPSKKNKINLIRSAIRIQIIELMSDYESNVVKSTSKNDAIAQDIISRASLFENNLLFLAYYKVGGINALVRTRSVRKHQEYLEKFSSDIETLHEMMRIYHYWEMHLKGNPLYAPPSKRKSGEILNALRRGSKNYIGIGDPERLEKHIMRRASLIYAASSINFEQKSTLLEEMIKNRLSYDALSDNFVIHTWLSRAKYINEAILRDGVEIENQSGRENYIPYRWNKSHLPTHLEAQRFELSPPYPVDIEQILRQGFVRNKGGRGKKAKKCSKPFPASVWGNVLAAREAIFMKHPQPTRSTKCHCQPRMPLPPKIAKAVSHCPIQRRLYLFPFLPRAMSACPRSLNRADLSPSVAALGGWALRRAVIHRRSNWGHGSQRGEQPTSLPSWSTLKEGFPMTTTAARRKFPPGGGFIPPPSKIKRRKVNPAKSAQASAGSAKQNTTNVFEGFNDFGVEQDTSVVELAESVRKAMQNIERGYRRKLYVEVAHAAALGLYLSQSPEQWKRFCLSKHWHDTPEKPPPVNEPRRAIYHVLRFVRSGCGNAQKDASSYSLAIQSLLDQGISPSALPKAIEDAGGLRKLYDKIRAQQKADGVKQVKGGNHAHKLKSSAKINAAGAVSVYSEPASGITLELRAKMTDENFKTFRRLQEGSSALLAVIIDSVSSPTKITIREITPDDNSG